jgi:hypothetical protein
LKTADPTPQRGPLKHAAVTLAMLQIDLTETELHDAMAINICDPGILIGLKGNPISQAALAACDAGPGADFAPRDETAVPQIYHES